MFKSDFIKKMTHDLAACLPEHIGVLKRDFEKNCQSVLQSTFAKFDLVTREEFDTQTKVLAKTRKKLEEMEAHIAVLEDLIKTRKTHGRKE